jgi:hypothetical protein
MSSGAVTSVVDAGRTEFVENIKSPSGGRVRTLDAFVSKLQMMYTMTHDHR